VDATEIYFADLFALGGGTKENVTHDSMLKNSQIQTQVLGLLRIGRGIWAASISTEIPTMTHNALKFSAMSPVRLRVFDSDGNHTGLLPDGSVEEAIPGSTFDRGGEDQFVTVPDGNAYRVLAEGVGQGSLTLWQTEIDSTGLVLRTIEWDQVPVQPGSISKMTTQFGAPSPKLSVDLDGDGVPEQTLAPTRIYPGGGGPMLLADLNGDGKVDAADLAIVQASFGATRGDPRYNPIADVNHDDIVDIRDLAWVSQAVSACGQNPRLCR
jgi:Dockerin type I domain